MFAATASSLCGRLHPQHLLGSPVSRSSGTLVSRYLLLIEIRSKYGMWRVVGLPFLILKLWCRL